MTTPRLNMDEIAESQANKYVTHNEALRVIDGLVMPSVEDKDLVTSPSVATADEGKVWIVAGTGGDWSGFSVDDLAQYYDGAWYNHVPEEGWTLYVKDENKHYYYDGSDWKGLAGAVGVKEKFISAVEMTLGGARDPDWEIIQNNVGPNFQGVRSWTFDPSTDEELYCNMSLPSNYEDNSDLTITAVYQPSDTNTGTTVVWGIEYVWADIDSGTGVTQIVQASDTIPGGGSKDSFNYEAVFSTISGSGREANSILFMRVFRDANNTSDTYPSDAHLIGIRIEW